MVHVMVKVADAVAYGWVDGGSNMVKSYRKLLIWFFIWLMISGS